MKFLAGLEPNDVRQINVELGDYDKIAVSFSGGMDSTLMLYLLLKEKELRGLSTEIHCFTATQVGTKIHSQNVLALPEFAGKVVHHTDCDNPISESVKPMTLKLLDEGWQVFAASNATPLEDIGGRYPPRPAKNSEVKNLHLPFVFLFKYHIVDSYFRLGIDHIIETTHTCTEWIHGECGECFACREKFWGFEKINRPIPNSAHS